MSLKRKIIAAASEPAEEEIQRAAYHLWLESGCLPGRDLENWFTARELLRHRRPTAQPRQRPAAAAAVQPPLRFRPSKNN
ncbi:MAG TPA: DUF2934 domain-containing protein [Opitutaceae bacterium]|nr:DUF2934 domain-containing protein [Opitutaceae bacterium]